MSNDNDEDKNRDMSQGDILDSIRKMVENDKNSSVLELTDLLDEDGNITKVSKDKISKKNRQKETDVGDFLRLIKDNKSMLENSTVENSDLRNIGGNVEMDDANDNIISSGVNGNNDYIHRIVDKTVKEYLDANLPTIVKKTVESVVVNMLRKM